MGFEWGSPRPEDQPGYLRPEYNGKPAPPWPPARHGAYAYTVCLRCPHQRCKDCPADRWERRTYAPPATSEPERREPFLTLLFRKVTRK